MDSIVSWRGIWKKGQHEHKEKPLGALLLCILFISQAVLVSFDRFFCTVLVLARNTGYGTLSAMLCRLPTCVERCCIPANRRSGAKALHKRLSDRRASITLCREHRSFHERLFRGDAANSTSWWNVKRTVKTILTQKTVSHFGVFICTSPVDFPSKNFPAKLICGETLIHFVLNV